MTVPVIFIHWGSDPRYELSTILKRAEKSGNPVALLRDIPSEGMASDFERLYEHMSTNPPSFEIPCFTRWFILCHHMARFGITEALYCDSDVLLFADATQEWKTHFKDYDYTLALGTSAATSFFTLAALFEFCRFVMDAYSNKDGETFLEMRRFYRDRQARGLNGGVCDMTLWRLFKATGKLKVGEMTEIRGGTTWDHSINSPDNFEMRDGIKRIDFENGIPYGYRILDYGTERVRFNSLHFQGGSKHLIKPYSQLEAV